MKCKVLVLWIFFTLPTKGLKTMLCEKINIKNLFFQEILNCKIFIICVKSYILHSSRHLFKKFNNSRHLFKKFQQTCS